MAEASLTRHKLNDSLRPSASLFAYLLNLPISILIAKNEL